jgi:hypothetical protein
MSETRIITPEMQKDQMKAINDALDKFAQIAAALKEQRDELLVAAKASYELGCKIYHNANAHEAPMDWRIVKQLLEAAIVKAEGHGE